ncbi:hypothetical protein STEG23_006905, partial [Scotinomys teguina]
EKIGTVFGSDDRTVESHEAKAFVLGWTVLGSIPNPPHPECSIQQEEGETILLRYRESLSQNTSPRFTLNQRYSPGVETPPCGRLLSAELSTQAVLK